MLVLNNKVFKIMTQAKVHLKHCINGLGYQQWP